MNLDLSKASGPDYIPVVLLKKCEPELSYILADSSTSVLRSLVFQIVGRFCLWSLCLRMLGKGLLLKATALLVFFLWIVDHLKKCSLFSDFQYGFRSSRSTADLLTVVSNRMLGLLTGLELLELWHLIYPRLLTGFGMLVFFTNLSLMEFHVRYSALFLLFSVIDDFEWLWMESLDKNIQLMREFLKAPFLVLHFSYYTLMTFLMRLSVILLSMLILLSILGVIGLLICGNNLNWLLNLNLIYETRWTGVRSGLLISMLGKLSWFCLTGLITMVLLM